MTSGAVTASDQSETSPQRKTYGFGPVFIMGAIWAVQEGQGTAYGAALDSVKNAFHVSDLVLSLVSPGMKLSGVVAGLLMGVLSDRMSRGRLLMALMTLWTIAMVGNALVPTFAVFYAARLFVAFGESPDAPSASLMGDFYEVEERGRRYSQLRVGTAFGAAIALGMTGPLVDNFGWRAWPLSWVPFGIACVVLTARLPEPARGRQDAAFDESKLGHVEAAEQAGEHVTSLANVGLREAARDVLKVRTWRWAVAGLMCATMVEGALQTFGISLFKRMFHLSESKATVYVAVGGIGALIGVFGGGYLADRLLARGVVRARIWVSAAAWLVAPVALIPALLIKQTVPTVALFFVSSLCFGIPAGPVDAFLTDVMLPDLRGRAAAVRNVADAVTATGVVLVGAMSTAFGSLRVAFLVLSPVFLIGTAFTLIGARTYTDDLAFVVGHARRTHE